MLAPVIASSIASGVHRLSRRVVIHGHVLEGEEEWQRGRGVDHLPDWVILWRDSGDLTDLGAQGPG